MSKTVEELQEELNNLKEINTSLNTQLTEVRSDFDKLQGTSESYETELKDTKGKLLESNFNLKASQSGLNDEQVNTLKGIVDFTKVSDDLDLTKLIQVNEKIIEKESEEPKEPKEPETPEPEFEGQGEDNFSELLGYLK